MSWAINHDVTHYISPNDGCVDAESPINPGESVLIRKGDNEFKVLVHTLEDKSITGTVLSIGPIPVLKAQGITRGQMIAFNQVNVFCIYRFGEVA